MRCRGSGKVITKTSQKGTYTTAGQHRRHACEFPGLEPGNRPELARARSLELSRCPVGRRSFLVYDLFLVLVLPSSPGLILSFPLDFTLWSLFPTMTTDRTPQPANWHPVELKKDGTVSKMRSHKGNIPVLPQNKLCPHCPAKFTRTTHLNRHLRTRKPKPILRTQVSEYVSR